MSTLQNPPFVSVIILNFNGKDYLNNCLFSVLNNNYSSFEVVLVDNGSTDSSIKDVEKTFGNDKRLKIFKSNKNLGFGAGNNFGLARAGGQFMVFLNSDTTVDANWLAVLVDALEKDPSIGLAQSLILSIDGKIVGNAGWLWSDYLLFLHPLGRARKSDFNFVPLHEVSFVSGCSMIARKELLDEIGLFDPDIPFNYDDTLLSFKVWLSGKRVVTVRDSRVNHIGGVATKKYLNNYSVLFSNFRAKLLLIFDLYFNFSDLSRAMAALSFSLAFDTLYAVKENRSSVLSANIGAIAWVLNNLKHVWMSRAQHWSKAKISPESLLEKTIRVKLRFPLCLIRSRTNYRFYRNEIIKHENFVSQKSM
jgi:GT2 family glycosyltransferase